MVDELNIELSGGRSLGVDNKEGSKAGEAGTNTRLGKYQMHESFPPVGKEGRAHEGSQSSAPGKEDPIGERGSGYSSY